MYTPGHLIYGYTSSCNTLHHLAAKHCTACLTQGYAGIPSLQELAAAALRSALLQQLQALQAASLAAPPSPTPTSRCCSLGSPLGAEALSLADRAASPSDPDITPRRKSRSRDVRRSMGLRDDIDDCEICFAGCANARIQGCKHTLCCECASQLCKIGGPSGQAPSCPFCRGCIGGFCAAS